MTKRNDAKGAVGRDDLADKAYKAAAGMTRSAARAIVDQVLAEIVEGLVQDGKVLLTGFGHFSVNAKGPRVGRNPRTGKEYPIAARKSVSFRAAAGVRNAVSNGG